MRTLFALTLVACIARPHGESSRTPQPATTGPQVFPTGGPTSTPRDSRGGPRTLTDRGWETWLAYNLETVLAERLRGSPTSGAERRANDLLSRERLREKRLPEILLRALEDKSHYVRASAAVALGKLGKPDANRFLERHSRFPGEGWYDVREASIYAMGVLGLTENRTLMTVLAGDKERAVMERSLALVSLLFDGSQRSLDTLRFHLDYFKSSVRFPSYVHPTLPEEEKRRLAAHLLGFVREADAGHDDYLYEVALGSRKWGPAVQGLAVTALGRRRARGYAERLFRVMARRDTDDAVRQSIPIALGLMLERTDRDDIRRLARFVRDHRREEVVQHFTLMALADIGGPEVEGILLGFLRDNVFNSDEQRAFLFLAMGRTGQESDELKDALLCEYTETRVWSKRAALAVALALARHEKAVPLTIRYLEGAPAPAEGGQAAHDPPGGGRPELDQAPPADFLPNAVLALGLHGDARGLPVVRAAIEKYHLPAVRQRGAQALALLLRQQAVPELIEMLEESGNVYTKAAAVTALGLIPEPTEEAVAALVAAYRRDSHPDTVRAMAVIALGALGDPRLTPLSAHLTSRYNYFIRCFALDEIASYL